MLSLHVVPLLLLALCPNIINALTNTKTMALGDSITYGYLSTDGNGYRKTLKDSLASAGNTIDFVGRINSGNMTDNQDEGWIGYTITQVAAKAAESAAIALNPSLILLMAGTNDMNDAWIDKSTAPANLAALVDQLFKSFPSATIVVSGIIPISDATNGAYVAPYNSAAKALVNQRASAGKKVLWIDSTLTTSNLGDGLHPNDAGYVKMGKDWLGGVNSVIAKGWVS
ncbi:SGNH hydrolase-type esterase domain-containing protein [Flagelloscypha sp. PMI_526]|nr:SGNH hydrolase-type esterase domain-containing protein [Flagelloscypha sp. PMI_526]